MKYVIAIAAAFAVMAVVSQFGVQQERARVVKLGEQAHARAQAARKKVEVKKPPELREDLRRFCVDCDAR